MRLAVSCVPSFETDKMTEWQPNPVAVILKRERERTYLKDSIHTSELVQIFKHAMDQRAFQFAIRVGNEH